MTRRGSAVAALVGIFAIAPLQGCLLTRVMETRAQLCDEQPARVIVLAEAGRGLRVVFDQPTLTEQDVIRIAGFEPSSVREVGARREFFYEARPADRTRDAAAGLVARLTFVPVGGESRLAEIEIPEQFNAILPPPLLDAAVKVTCKAQIAVVPPRTTFDLAAVDRTTLPTRPALTRLLGPPTVGAAGARELSYRYCLLPCDSGQASIANLGFAFDDRGNLERATASYFRYVATLDLVAPRPVGIVELR